jgi:hypothetical protein
MLHPDTELRFISAELGYGVVATRLIRRGTITWVRDGLDQVIAPDRIAELPDDFRCLLEKYTTRELSGNHILTWDLGRFVNHACNAKCLDPSGDSRVEIAVRDIAAGEQLTSDYANVNLWPHESFACHCGAHECRKWVTPDDAMRESPHWRELLLEAAGHSNRVSQPLLWAVREMMAAPGFMGQAWRVLDFRGYLQSLVETRKPAAATAAFRAALG